MSHTGRTLAMLRRNGYLAEVVERWLQIPGKPTRRDLFRVADVLAVHPVRKEFLLVQVTTAGNLSHRLTKARAQPALVTWIRAGGLFEVWGFRRLGKRWAVQRVAIRAADLQPEVVARIPRAGRVRQPMLFE